MCAAALIAAALSAVTSAQAQQLHRQVTGPQCAAMGGRIITWTNTAGQGTPVGECLVPPRGGGGGSGYAPPPANNAAGNAAAALGVAAGFVGLLDALGTFNATEEPATPASEPSPSAAEPQEPRIVLAERNLERGARHNRVRKPCDAARFFALAARQFADVGESDRQKDALFQASLSQADCEDNRRRAAAEARNAAGGVTTASVGAGAGSGARQPQRIPRPPADEGDEKYVYWCPPGDGVYDLVRRGRYVKPGEGCGSRPAQRLPKPEGPAGDEKFVYYCPDESNVTGGGRYVSPGEGCGGAGRGGAGKKTAATGKGGAGKGGEKAGGDLPPEVLQARLAEIARHRKSIATLPDGPERTAALAELDRLERTLTKR